jgi:hypothetical protein
VRAYNLGEMSRNATGNNPIVNKVDRGEEERP